MLVTQALPSDRWIRSRLERRGRLGARAALVRWLPGIVVAGLVLGAAGSARAEALPQAAPPEMPKNYVTTGLGTTLAYRPPGGPADGGWQHNIATVVGYGRFVAPSLAVELGVGTMFIRGDYASFSVTPGVLWPFAPPFYAAMRFVVPVDPQLDLILFPGFGVAHFFSNRIGVSLEINPASTVGRGDPDFIGSMSTAVAYSF